MRKLKSLQKIVLALLSVMVLVISVGIFTLPAKAASGQACAAYCMGEYYNPYNVIGSLLLVAACMDGCVNGPIK